MGAAELLDYDRATAARAGPGRGRGRPAMSPSSRARWASRSSARSTGVVSLSENGDAIIVDGDDGEVHLRPHCRCRGGLCREGALPRPAAGALPGAARASRRSPRTAARSTLLMNAGLARRPAAAGRIGRRRHRPVPHRAAVHDRVDAFRAPRRRSSSIATCSMRPRGRPVTFRTLDIGGDKVLPYFAARRRRRTRRSAGGRSGSASTGRALLRTQLRALLKARGGRELSSCCRWSPKSARSTQAREVIDREVAPSLAATAHKLPTRAQARRHGRGAVAAVAARRTVRAVDFVSVGSNDLFQFMMATDRGNTRVAERFDPLSRAVPARAASRSSTRATRVGTPVTLCGELAGKPLSAHGPARHRLPLAFDVAGLDRPGQGDAYRAAARPV